MMWLLIAGALGLAALSVVVRIDTAPASTPERVPVSRP
jgi:hypothetical protein